MHARVDTIDGVRIALILADRKPIALVARPDNNALWTGDVVRGRIMRYAAAQKAYFAETDGGPVMVPHKSASAYKPGDGVTIAIERPKTRDKDARGTFTDASLHKPDFHDFVRGEYPDAAFSSGLDDYAEFIVGLRRKHVDCGDGITIVIDNATAATIVDVNAAAPNMTPLAVNCRAADALFYHMALRNLQGQIIVDFLRLRSPDDKKLFQTHIERLAAQQARHITLYGFTRLGLFELTREKRGLSLDDIFMLAGR